MSFFRIPVSFTVIEPTNVRISSFSLKWMMVVAIFLRILHHERTGFWPIYRVSAQYDVHQLRLDGSHASSYGRNVSGGGLY